LNDPRRLERRFLAMAADWERLSEQYLPVPSDHPVWRFSRPPTPTDPEQGWKLHLSATILTACKVLRRVGPGLAARSVLYKAPRTLEELNRLNSGSYGFSQIGKFLTVYPRSRSEAVGLAAQLHEATLGIASPEVPFDRRYGPGSCVHYRFGGSGALVVRDPLHGDLPAIRGPGGTLVADVRGPGKAVPRWVRDPFVYHNGASENGISELNSPLATVYRAYEAISQRGKGGVYRCLDLSSLPARRSILKEGRRHGETDVYGRDGHWRTRHEARVLRTLRVAGIPVPSVYDTFEVGGNYYLVMEHVEGQSLQSLCDQRRRRLPTEAALRLGLHMAILVSQMHELGWAWRDGNPSNIIVTSDGALRPLDFEGGCRLESSSSIPWSRLPYRPPEWRAGHGGSPLGDDLYALGVSLYQLLTCRPPGGDPRLLGRSPVRNLILALMHPDSSERPSAQVAVSFLEDQVRSIGESCEVSVR